MAGQVALVNKEASCTSVIHINLVTCGQVLQMEYMSVCKLNNSLHEQRIQYKWIYSLYDFSPIFLHDDRKVTDL